jgi:NAD(P)-dependent dehydrogenase (short-subunit alcohol dehydrogenase family)
MRELTDKGAVVTGGGSGIGRAIALALADAGADVVIADLDGRAAEAVAAEVAARGRRGLAVETDVSERASVDRLADAAWNALGAVHVLCNNAGVFRGGPLDRASDADWQWLVAVNLWGVVHGIQAFVPRLRDQGQGGHVVNTASLAGQFGVPGTGIYTATKYAVVGLSEVLAQDLAAHGIGVSVLCPGMVSTRIWEGARHRPAAFGGPEPSPPGTGEFLSQAGIDPAVAGDEVVQAIRSNRLYVFTHPELRGMVDARSRRVLADYDELVARRAGDGERGGA